MASAEAMELTATSNPFLDFYNAYCEISKQDLYTVFDPSVSAKKRAKMYKAVDVSVAMKYAWAIPDERALRIIKHYGPIVEMGAGTGYWGRLLQLRGVDIICYDLHVADDDEDGETNAKNDSEDDSGDEEEAECSEGDEDEEQGSDDDDVDGMDAEQAGNDSGEEGEDDSEDGVEDSDEEVEVELIYWMDVLKGTPKDLRKHSDRTLFLCYPDDFEDSRESMALKCLENYTGEYVIHIGEMFGQTLCLPGPWGRTSSSEFQIHLASVYHKVLQVPLPSWHSSIDALTVWKRTKTSIMDNCFYAFIPAEERLDLLEATPSTRHLLEQPGAETSSRKRKTQEKELATVPSTNKNRNVQGKYNKDKDVKGKAAAPIAVVKEGPADKGAQTKLNRQSRKRYAANQASTKEKSHGAETTIIAKASLVEQKGKTKTKRRRGKRVRTQKTASA